MGCCAGTHNQLPGTKITPPENFSLLDASGPPQKHELIDCTEILAQEIGDLHVISDDNSKKDLFDHAIVMKRFNHLDSLGQGKGWRIYKIEIYVNEMITGIAVEYTSSHLENKRIESMGR